MLRLTLAARITMIVLIALTAAWIGAIALYYRSQDRPGAGGLPSPQQIAALAALIERTPDGQRALVLDAVASDTLRATLERSQGVAAAPAGAPSSDERTRQAYAAALGGRPLTIAAPPPDLGARFPRLAALARRAVVLRIALKTGETLVVDARTPVLLSRFGLPVGFGAGLFGTLVALAALIIMHRETRPLRRLAAAVDRIDLAGPPEQLPQARGSAPEIRALITAFNRLQARLSLLLRARLSLLGGISHDVRSFATRLRLRVERIPQGAERERAIGDIADMIRLLDDALLASRAGAGELAEELVEPAEIVRAEVEDRRQAGAAIDLRVGPGADDASVLGDRVALRRIVANLADNALKYGRAAHLALACEAQTLVLTVDDEGPGIPADQREMLLEPFVRLEGSRNRRTGGAGLGLAVVSSLLDALGGAIAITDGPAGGARFTVRLPVFVPA